MIRALVFDKRSVIFYSYVVKYMFLKLRKETYTAVLVKHITYAF